LRYERQIPIQAGNNTWATVSYADLFGESGANNLFKPNCSNPCLPSPTGGATAPAGHSAYTLFGEGAQAYAPTGIFLPSFGFTYSPNWKAGMFKHLLGESGQTVIRGGFSMASVREGTGVFTAVTGGNPGGTITTNRSLTLANLPVGTYLRQGPFTQPAFPASPVYPNNGLITDAVNAFDPNLKIGYIESWSFGVQREFKKDNVIELRYTGNRGHRLWRQIDLNELNIIENGVYGEWQLAQQNLLANIAADRCQVNPTTITAANPNGTPFQDTNSGAANFLANCRINFAYFGPGTGTFALPITAGYFNNSAASATNVLNYTNSNFRTASFYNTMNPLNANPLSFGSQLAATSFDSRRTPLGQACFGIASCTGTGLFPYNMFYANAGKRADPFLVNNSAQSWYDAFTVEFRRRFSKGLLIQSSYTFGKTLSNTYASSSAVFDQPMTLRNNWLKKGVAPFDIRHGFKANFLYDLPFGKGKTFFSGANGWVDHLIGGWGFNGNIRMQSGIPFTFNSATLGGATAQVNVSNIQLVGMSFKELQNAVGVYRDPDGFIYLLPKDIRDNTVKAFNVQITSAGPSYSTGAPTGRYLAPAGSGNCAQSFAGQCGFANLTLHGPGFFRSDLALSKKFRFTETINLEIRTEFLNAFNNINFQPGVSGNDLNGLGSLTSSAFGRMTSAYQDLSTTNDPGGRVGQIVVRVNF